MEIEWLLQFDLLLACKAIQFDFVSTQIIILFFTGIRFVEVKVKNHLNENLSFILII